MLSSQIVLDRSILTPKELYSFELSSVQSDFFSSVPPPMFVTYKCPLMEASFTRVGNSDAGKAFVQLVTAGGPSLTVMVKSALARRLDRVGIELFIYKSVTVKQNKADYLHCWKEYVRALFLRPSEAAKYRWSSLMVHTYANVTEENEVLTTVGVHPITKKFLRSDSGTVTVDILMNLFDKREIKLYKLRAESKDSRQDHYSMTLFVASREDAFGCAQFTRIFDYFQVGAVWNVFVIDLTNSVYMFVPLVRDTTDSAFTTALAGIVKKYQDKLDNQWICVEFKTFGLNAVDVYPRLGPDCHPSRSVIHFYIVLCHITLHCPIIFFDSNDEFEHFNIQMKLFIANGEICFPLTR